MFKRLRRWWWQTRLAKWRRAEIRWRHRCDLSLKRHRVDHTYDWRDPTLTKKRIDAESKAALYEELLAADFLALPPRMQVLEGGKSEKLRDLRD